MTAWRYIATNRQGDTLAYDKYRDVAPIGETDVRFEDIARALSYSNRFNGLFGQVPTAAHCMTVRALAAQDGADGATQRWALLHDAHEAYTGDIPGPLKSVIDSETLRNLEAGLDLEISEVFRSPVADVKKWDMVCLALESEWFCGLAASHFRAIRVTEEQREVFRDCVRLYRLPPPAIVTAYTEACKDAGIVLP